MRSKISKQLDDELLVRVFSMSVDDRVKLAFSLGDEAVRAYAHAHGISLLAARQALRAAREAERPRRRRA